MQQESFSQTPFDAEISIKPIREKNMREEVWEITRLLMSRIDLTALTFAAVCCARLDACDDPRGHFTQAAGLGVIITILKLILLLSQLHFSALIIFNMLFLS